MAELLDPTEIMYTAFEPHQSQRFIMYVEGIPSYLIKMADKPKLATTAVTLDHINIERKVKGKSRWQDVTITMYDAIVPSTAQATMEWVRLGHESVTGRDGYSDFYKKDIVLNSLGPVGDKTQEWTLKGAQPINVDFGAGDWSSDGEVVNIAVTLAIDYCILQY